jgi:hypothetical protein
MSNWILEVEIAKDIIKHGNIDAAEQSFDLYEMISASVQNFYPTYGYSDFGKPDITSAEMEEIARTVGIEYLKQQGYLTDGINNYDDVEDRLGPHAGDIMCSVYCIIEEACDTAAQA